MSGFMVWGSDRYTVFICDVVDSWTIVINFVNFSSKTYNIVSFVNLFVFVNTLLYILSLSVLLNYTIEYSSFEDLYATFPLL